MKIGAWALRSNNVNRRKHGGQERWNTGMISAAVRWENTSTVPPTAKLEFRIRRRTTILIVLATLTMIACNKPQPVQTKRAAPAVEDASQPRLATLSQQKLCAEQADKQFNIYGLPPQ